MIECSEKSKKTHKYGEMANIFFKLRNKEILTIITVFLHILLAVQINTYVHI